MKHQAKNRKFGRKRDQRKALLKSLMNNLVKYEKIETTEMKAKEVRPKIEKMITRARKDSVATRRLLARYFQDEMVKKMADKIGPKYATHAGGYTRIIKTGSRKGDGSPMAIIEFV